MLSRRSFGPAAAALAVSTVTAVSAMGQTANKLFFIQRSKNANEIHYDARVCSATATSTPRTPSRATG